MAEVLELFTPTFSELIYKNMKQMSGKPAPIGKIYSHQKKIMLLVWLDSKGILIMSSYPGTV